MKNSKWIWCKTKYSVDNYAEFICDFDFSGKSANFNIACDGICAVFVNEKLAFFTQCADFPNYKLYDKVDITNLCTTQSKNSIKIIVWHLGQSNQIYISDKAGVIFSVEQDGKTIISSNKNILSREMTEYKNEYCKKITNQLGNSFYYDNTTPKTQYLLSEEVDKPNDLHLRLIKPLSLLERLPIIVIKKKDSIIIDMQKEVAGFIELYFESSDNQEILFTYGEHLKDGKVRRLIEGRDFSFEFFAKSGVNQYVNPLRRIAGRYIEVFAKSPIKINYIGIRPVMYPLEEKPFMLQDELLQEIYDTSIYTLKCCMHEHYEDCPWREQALYTMDSRNQMLCGYYAFRGFDYQRYNLVLISKSLRKDGLLSICAPAGSLLTIPFFSLIYIKQVCEYIEYSGDKDILKEVGGVIDTIIKTFNDRIDKTGLIISFPYPNWNFYEWTDGSDNGDQITRLKDSPFTPSYDLILNCAYIHALEVYSKTTGKVFSLANMKSAIKNMFSMGDEYKLSSLTNKTSELGNSFAILIGIGGEKLAEKLILEKNDMVKVSLSMKTFIYDALLSFGEKYKDYILNDIKVVYKKMLSQGTTTFWETELGEADFGGAGSLCHGWSAMPVYYLHKFFDKK